MSVYYLYVDDDLVLETLFDLAERHGWQIMDKTGYKGLLINTSAGTVHTQPAPAGSPVDAFEMIRLIRTGPDKVKLELTPGEAQALWDVTSKVGGHPIKSRRKLIDAIRQKLCPEGIAINRTSVLADMTGSTSFLPK